MRTYGPQTLLYWAQRYVYLKPGLLVQYKIQSFIVVFTRFCHWNLFCERDYSVLGNAMKNVYKK